MGWTYNTWPHTAYIIMFLSSPRGLQTAFQSNKLSQTGIGVGTCPASTEGSLACLSVWAKTQITSWLAHGQTIKLITVHSERERVWPGHLSNLCVLSRGKMKCTFGYYTSRDSEWSSITGTCPKWTVKQMKICFYNSSKFTVIMIPYSWPDCTHHSSVVYRV